MDQRAVLLSSQLSFQSLSRIFVPLAEQRHGGREAPGSVQVAVRLNELQLGAPQAAWAVSEDLCEVICHKARHHPGKSVLKFSHACTFVRRDSCAGKPHATTR